MLLGSVEESDIVECIQSPDVSLRNEALELIYQECYPRIESFVVKNSGSQFEAKDVFQEGTMILYQNIKKGKFNRKSSLFTYLYAICRNLWLIQLKKGTMKINRSIDSFELNVEDVKEEQINLQVLKKIMLELKKDCQDILINFYYEMKSMREIADIFKFGSEQVAKNKKSRCLKALTKLISDKGLTYENFME